jgi:hypothetical protein
MVSRWCRFVEPVTLEHVSVLTNDSSPPGDELLVHALEWASALRLPLQILNPPKALACVPLEEGRVVGEGYFLAGNARSASRGETPQAVESSSFTNQLFRPDGLSIFSTTLPGEIKNRLVRYSLISSQNAILACSRSCSSISRVLILHGAHDEATRFLHCALSLCRLFGATPVILTVARTEIQARQGQRMAEEACLHHRTPALLDYAVGLQLRAAVLSIARWRRCSHVFTARRRAISWWRWPRGDILNSLLGSADSLNLLVLPESGIRVPDSAPQDVIGSDLLAPH